MTTDDLALTMLPHVGARTAAHLIEIFGMAAQVMQATAEQLQQQAEMRAEAAAAIIKAREKAREQAYKELRNCEKQGVIAIAATDELYPPLLHECGDHPHVIFFKGDQTALQKRMVSMVGTRMGTGYGQKTCGKLVDALAKEDRNIVIVSGLAFGIDADCHRAALDAGLATIGVLASPVTSITPASHAPLAEQMMRRGGGLLSEYHSGIEGAGRLYTPRNRIIAGMSAGTVVVESSYSGGSMITADLADGYGRILMAVPGRVGDSKSEGTNFLIKTNRARCVCSGRDIAMELGWALPADAASKPRFGGSRVALGEYAGEFENIDTYTPQHHSEPPTGGVESASEASPVQGLPPHVAELLDPNAILLYSMLPDGEAMGLEEMGAAAGLSLGELSSALLELEFNNLIRMLPGKQYEKE